MKREQIITSSQQKKRDIQRSNLLNNAFTDVITLDELIESIYSQFSTKVPLEQALIPTIIYELVRSNKIEYFSYVKHEGQTINILSDFLILCNRNNCPIDTFRHDSEKSKALSTLLNAYTSYKSENKLDDIGDKERFVFQTLQSANSVFSKYDAVYIDKFEVDNVKFYKSWYHEEIVKLLNKQFANLEYTHKETMQCKLHKPQKECFNKLDEMRCALKITRMVLEDGALSSDVCIVTSSIKEYAPLFRLLLDEYGLKGYDTVGIPLSLYRNPSKHTDEKVQLAFHQHKSNIKKLELFAKKYNLTFDEKMLGERLKDSTYVNDERIGIMLTEPNQIAGLSRRYKHIIFVGTDMTHFPPKSDDNFLYTVSDAIEKFYLNSAYLNSLYHFNELQRLSDNLYILQPTYEGKRKLSPSILMPHNIDHLIDVSMYESVNEMYLTKKIANASNSIIDFTASLTSDEFTSYDGCNVDGISVNHLSASQINTYLSCPLKYLYTNKLGLQAPRSTEEGFDAAETGSLMHLCFEYYGKYIKEHGESEDLYGLMHLMSIEAYNDFIKDNDIEPNIYHEITLRDLQKGLVNEDPKNLLAKFVDYYTNHQTHFNHFKESSFEKQFLLDKDLKPTEDESLAFIKGYIDRMDIESKNVSIIDYKSKKMTTDVDTKKQEQVNQLKDVQLALYILYAKQTYPDRTYDAHLLSFKGDKPYYKFASLNNHEDGEYSDQYEDSLKKIIKTTCDDIESGKFSFDNRDEKVCEYCDIKLMCFAQNLEKRIIEEIQ